MTKFVFEKGYISRQNISIERWTKLFIAFVSPRVIGKNYFRRPRFNFCFIKAIIINKT